MRIPSSLPKTIPLFPIRGALLLPRAHLPLNVFEPRFLQLIEDSLKTDERLIGLVQTGAEDEAALQTVGCVGRITSFTETDDGRYLITISGISRFELLDEVHLDTPYRNFNVSWDRFEMDRHRKAKESNIQRSEFLDLLNRFFASEGLETDWEKLESADNELLINSLSMLCPFSEEDKQALLEATDLQKRLETLIALMEFSLHGGSSKDVM